MSGRRPDPRLVKIHRTYTVHEITELLGVHKNTVRGWLKDGLATIDQKRPLLVHGLDLANFLRERRRRSKQPCPPGHLFCVRCRAARPPAGNMVDYIACTANSGNLRGICPTCDSLVHRRVSLTKLRAVCAGLEVTFLQGDARIRESPSPSVNCDSTQGR